VELEPPNAESIDCDIDFRIPENEPIMGPVEDLLEIIVDENKPTKVLKIGTKLNGKIKE
ncbi:hypothetical protein TorRG33x02_342260, partial [Trema orientale]